MTSDACTVTLLSLHFNMTNIWTFGNCFKEQSERAREREATHQHSQLAEGDRRAVEEIRRQPALVLVTVANGRACDGKGGGRGGVRCYYARWEIDCSLKNRLRATSMRCHYFMVIRASAEKTSYPESPWGRGLLQGAQTWSGATRFHPGWPEGSCHRWLAQSVWQGEGRGVFSVQNIVNGDEPECKYDGLLPSQPLAETSAKGLSQRLHWRPITPDLHWHWPLSRSHVLEKEPTG